MSPFVSEITIILLPIFSCLSHIIVEAFIIIALPMEDDQSVRNYFHFKTYSLNVFIMRCNKVFVGLLRLQQTMLYCLLPVSHIIILLLQDDQSVHNYFYSKTYFQNVFFFALICGVIRSFMAFKVPIDLAMLPVLVPIDYVFLLVLYICLLRA